jgi:hypothetical protein
MRARLPLLRTANLESAALGTGHSGHECGIASMIRLSQAESGSKLAAHPGRNESLSLLLAAKMMKHQEIWKITSDTMLILQVIGKT